MAGGRAGAKKILLYSNISRVHRLCNTEHIPAIWGPERWALETAEEFVELVGGVEIDFEFAGSEFFAKVVEAAGEEIEGGGEDFLVSEDDIAPGGIGAAGEAEGIAQAGAGESDGEAVFVEMIVEERSERDGG